MQIFLRAATSSGKTSLFLTIAASALEPFDADDQPASLKTQDVNTYLDLNAYVNGYNPINKTHIPVKNGYAVDGPQNLPRLGHPEGCSV
jgi:hypothetical protein